MPLDPDLQTLTTASPNLITYNFSDIEDGTGVVSYFPMLARTTVAKYIMTNQTDSSELNGEGATFNAKTTIMDRTFETGKFNLPRTLKGTSILILPVAAVPDVGDDVILIDMTVTIKKFDGTDETTIVTITPLTETTVAGDSLLTKGITKFVIEMVVPRTTINIDDTIRVTVKVEMTKTAGAGTQCEGAVGFDPAGGAFNSVGAGATAAIADAQMKLNIPFQIE